MVRQNASQFSQAEIQQFNYVMQNGGKFTTSALCSYGYSYEQAKRLAYMYKVYSGQVSLDSEEGMIRHLKTMHRKDYKISISDFPLSKISTVPQLAVVSGITQPPYTIWNSSNRKGLAALYNVVDTKGRAITVETKIKPVLKYNAPKELPGQLKILGVKSNGLAVISFNKGICRLCNRYIIVASLRNPEFHLGKYTMLAFEGSKIYVYATNMGTGDKVKYREGTQRVYAFGIDTRAINGKLNNVAMSLYQHFGAVQMNFEVANTGFEIIERHRQLDDGEYTDDEE